MRSARLPASSARPPKSLLIAFSAAVRVLIADCNPVWTTVAIDVGKRLQYSPDNDTGLNDAIRWTVRPKRACVSSFSIGETDGHTASSFTLRKNAKRAAEAMIRKGTAPAIDYAIKPSDDGRFEIVWKGGNTTPTTDSVETEIVEASGDQPAASAAEKAPQPAPAATKPSFALPGTDPLRFL
jgi:hypothetical protein